MNYIKHITSQVNVFKRKNLITPNEIAVGRDVLLAMTKHCEVMSGKPIDVLEEYHGLKVITGFNFLPDAFMVGYDSSITLKTGEKTMKQLPQYKCHKIVRAAKIKEVADTADFGAFIHFEDDLDSIQVNSDYIGKHKPQVGGYYVVYNDGYESFSPCEAFEAGYVLIPTGGDTTLNDKETFSRFVEMAKRKLSKEDFEKVYGTILPIADTIPGFDK